MCRKNVTGGKNLSTLYEMFKVSENASQDEIKESYQVLLKKYESLPQTEELSKKVSTMKIAYGILSDTEKRKKYDQDLAQKRAEELLENVKITQESAVFEDDEKHKIDEKINSVLQEQRLKDEIDRQINNAIEKQKIDEKNRKLYEKQIKKQFRAEKRQAKKQRELEKEMQIQAYGKYLENQGYKVKYPWTWPRIKRLLISIIIVVISCFILWQIPFVRENLIKLYEENFIIKILVDIILSIFNGIASLLKH